MQPQDFWHVHIRGIGENLTDEQMTVIDYPKVLYYDVSLTY